MDLPVYNTLILSDLHLGAETSRAREATQVLKNSRFRGFLRDRINCAAIVRP